MNACCLYSLLMCIRQTLNLSLNTSHIFLCSQSAEFYLNSCFFFFNYACYYNCNANSCWRKCLSIIFSNWLIFLIDGRFLNEFEWLEHNWYIIVRAGFIRKVERTNVWTNYSPMFNVHRKNNNNISTRIRGFNSILFLRRLSLFDVDLPYASCKK